MPKILILALYLCLTFTAAHGQPLNGDSAIAAAQERYRILLDISDPVRAAFSDTVSRAAAVVRSDVAERTARAEEFVVSAANARSAMTTALERLDALEIFPDTPTDPALSALVRNQQESAVRGNHAGLELLGRLERVVSAHVNQDARVASEESHALLVASVLIARDAANQARLRARLTPETPWVEPMDNASAELIDGMASLIEIMASNPDRHPGLRASIQQHGTLLKQYAETASETIEAASNNPDLSRTIADLRPGLDQRIGWFNQAANELMAAGQSTNTSRQLQHLRTIRTLYQQITESQQSIFR